MNLHDLEILNKLAMEELEIVDKLQDSKNHYDKEVFDDAFRGHIKISQIYRQKTREQTDQVLTVQS